MHQWVRGSNEIEPGWEPIPPRQEVVVWIGLVSMAVVSGRVWWWFFQQVIG